MSAHASQCPACNEALPHSRLAREGCWLMRGEALSHALGDVTDRLGWATLNGDAFRDESAKLRARLLVERRRNVAATKVIARVFCDAHGNPIQVVPAYIDEISDILCGIKDGEIAAAIDAPNAEASR